MDFVQRSFVQSNCDETKSFEQSLSFRDAIREPLNRKGHPTAYVCFALHCTANDTVPFSQDIYTPPAGYLDVPSFANNLGIVALERVVSAQHVHVAEQRPRTVGRIRLHSAHQLHHDRVRVGGDDIGCGACTWTHAPRSVPCRPPRWPQTPQ